jgi:hypothetical protein
VERVGYLYHCYDPAADRFIYTGYSEMFGQEMRERNHVNVSKKPGVNATVSLFGLI